MHTEHRIDELIVDLSFTTTRLACHETALLSEWLSEKLLPALDQLFSRYSPGKQILRFETLVFDFGNLTSRNYQQAIREQLLQQCAQLLQAQLLEVTPTNQYSSAYASDNSNTRAALSQLFNYLASGQLSVHQPIEQKVTTVKGEKSTSSVKQPALHKQLLDAVIAQQNIAQLLRELPERDALVQRLLTQFSLLQRLELLRQLAPQHISSAIALLDLLQFFESHFNTTDSHKADSYKIDNQAINYQQLESKLRDSDVVQQSVWQALLHLGLANPQATEKYWIHEILHKLAARLALSEIQLQQSLVAIKLPSNIAAQAVIALQEQVAQWLSAESVAGESRFVAPLVAGDIDSQTNFSDLQHDGEQKNPEQLRQLIAAAFIRADASQLQQLWAKFIAREPELLLSAVQHYLPQAEIRQQLTLSLPIALQADIIGLLAPALNGIFYRIINKAIQLNELINAQTSAFLTFDDVSAISNMAEAGKPVPELLIRQLWEIAIGLLLNNSSTSVDYYTRSENFVMALAARYAELRNLNDQSLQQTLHSLFIDQQEINTTPQGTSNQESQRYRNNQDYQNSQDQGTESETTIVVLSESQWAPATPLVHSVTSAAAIESNKNNPTENDLSKVSDHQLFDLCLRLKSGALAWSSLAHDVRLLQRLIISYIRIAHSATTGNCGDFVAAIDAQAESSTHPSVFYLAVLQTLVADKLVDFDAIALGIQSNAKSKQVDDNGIQTNVQHISPDTYPAVAQLHARSADKNEFILVSSEPARRAITSTRTDELALQLQQGKITPETLDLNTDQFIQLVNIFIATGKTIAPDIQTDLTAAIHQQALQAIHIAEYYRRVLIRLVHQEELDLVLVCAQVNQKSDIDQPFLHQSPIENSLERELDQQNSLGAHDKQPLIDAAQLSTSAALIQNDLAHNSQLAAVTNPILAATSNKSVVSIVQSLLADPQELMHLQEYRLDAQQWYTVAIELLKQISIANSNSSAELIDAVQTVARQAIDPAVYYRLIIEAALKNQPIDLEVFAETAVSDEQIYSADNPSQPLVNKTAIKSIATTDSNQNTDNKNNPPLVHEQLQPEHSISAPHTSENSIFEHPISEKANDYSQLTGSDTSLRKPELSLEQLFASEQPLNQEQLLALQQYVNVLLNRSNQTLIAEWNQLLAGPHNGQLLIHSVPAHLLHQMVMRLQAARFTWLDAIVKVVMEALALLVNDLNTLVIKEAKWAFVFHYLFFPNNQSGFAETSAQSEKLAIELCEQLASAAGIDDVQRLVNLTQRRIALLKPPAQQKPAMRLQDIFTHPATHSDDTTPQWEAGLHINNAGQVLAAAFLPRLFSMLNLLQDGKFIHPGAAERAVHLVQFMVTGESATPEYELVMNKILCGISTSIPVSSGIEITEQEQTLIEQMLTSMIQHWKVLGSTSISGLRETFFQRQGWLVLEEDCWRLKVKEQTFDLLLDRLPWSISLIKHGWMDKPLRVSWRNDS